MSEHAFVPFCDCVIRRYAGSYQLPHHDVLDTKLHTGQIHLTLTAQTPVMVGNGKTDADHSVLFAQNPQGQYRIPGSSLRGLVRQNMQILGLGLIRVGRNDEIAELPRKFNLDLRPGLPQTYRNVRFDEDVLDYANSMLGYVGRKRNVGKKKIQDCYRSRVSFGELTAGGTPTGCNRIPVVLKSPPAYFMNKDGILPGTRQFPLKDPDENEQYFATQGIRPLDAGTKFSGTIRYRNLHTDELGLLLWCLCLEKDCCHTMGMAKSYGYGRMSLEIDGLVEYDLRNLYSSFSTKTTPVSNTRQRVAELIKAYQDYAIRQPGVRKLAPSLTEMPHIRQFFSLKKAPESN